MYERVFSTQSNTIPSDHTLVRRTRFVVMMLAIIFLNACGLSVKTKIVAELAQGASRDPVITDAQPSPPSAGETVVLTGTKFPSRTKNIIARVVLADGGTKDSPMTVTSVTNATFTVPTDTASEVKTILMMHNGKTMATFDIKVTPVGTFDALTFSPPAGTYAGTQSVTISSTQPGATIYYTTDGSTPTTNSAVYTSPISVTASQTITAYAAKKDFTDSAVAKAAYVINGAAATPTFSVADGTYNSAQSVAITTTTAGASIYYTTDGSTPTTSSSLYSAPLTVSSSQTLKAFATKSGYTNSGVVSVAYVINLTTVSTPTFSPGAGAYGPAQSVVISTVTAGSTIYYTTDGSTPTTSSLVYGSAIAVNSSQTLSAFAVKAGLADSGA